MRRQAVVVGLGRSGLAAARVLVEEGFEVVGNDRRSEAEILSELASLPKAVRCALGTHDDAVFAEADLVVVSPGVPDLPALHAVRRRGVPVLGELEFAFRRVSGRTVAITGTNGKSTTTALCGALFASTGGPVFVGGNLGTPLSEAIGTPAASASGVVVVEVSSFQLETVDQFHPRAAAILNITPDHLDRHPTMAAYVDAKARIFARQTPADTLVLNADEPLTASLATRTRAHVLWFSSRKRVVGGFVDGGELVISAFGGEERFATSCLQLFGRHNLENALAAILLARSQGVSREVIERALPEFRALPHRMQHVADCKGRSFYDDSKGTNVASTVKALSGFPRPVVLIAGGRDKHGDLAPLAEVVRAQVRSVVLIGEARTRFREALSGSAEILEANSLEEAVSAAFAHSRPGDAVVLSPACASFDMFRNYSHRGEVFQATVLGLAP